MKSKYEKAFGHPVLKGNIVFRIKPDRVIREDVKSKDRYVSAGC